MAVGVPITANTMRMAGKGKQQEYNSLRRISLLHRSRGTLMQGMILLERGCRISGEIMHDDIDNLKLMLAAANVLPVCRSKMA